MTENYQQDVETSKTVTAKTLEINSNLSERLRRIAGQNARTQELTTAIFKRSAVKIVI